MKTGQKFSRREIGCPGKRSNKMPNPSGWLLIPLIDFGVFLYVQVFPTWFANFLFSVRHSYIFRFHRKSFAPYFVSGPVMWNYLPFR